jgi:hypothetical protein
MRQNMKIKLDAIPVTKIDERIFIFVSFHVSASRVAARSVIGYGTESLGNHFSGIGKESPAFKALVTDYSLMHYHV